MSESRVAWGELRTFTREVFIRAGVQAEDADIEAEVIVWANLRGVDSHGVLRIPWYLDFIKKGVMNTRPNIRILKETPATLVIDADHALGIHSWSRRSEMGPINTYNTVWWLRSI